MPFPGDSFMEVTFIFHILLDMISHPFYYSHFLYPILIPSLLYFLLWFLSSTYTRDCPPPLNYLISFIHLYFLGSISSVILLRKSLPLKASIYIAYMYFNPPSNILASMSNTSASPVSAITFAYCGDCKICLYTPFSILWLFFRYLFLSGFFHERQTATPYFLRYLSN